MHTRLALIAGLALWFAACDGTLISEDDELPGAEEVSQGRHATSHFNAGEQAVVCETGGLGLRQRSGPGLGYARLRVMPEGARVEIQAGAYGWFKNTWEGKVGWSFGEYLCPGGSEPEAPPSQPAAPPAEKPAAPPAQSPTPPSSGRLTLGGIVGGQYSISQGYGPTTFWMDYSYCKSYGNWGGVNAHCAVDLSIPRGRTMYAPGAGRVIVAGSSPYYTDDFNPAAGQLKIELDNGTHVILGHCSRIDVSYGERVEAGQQVGASGTAGTGAHLHLEVRVPGGCAAGYCTTDPVTYFGK